MLLETEPSVSSGGDRPGSAVLLTTCRAVKKSTYRGHNSHLGHYLTKSSGEALLVTIVLIWKHISWSSDLKDNNYGKGG